MTTLYKSIVEEAEKELADLMNDIFIRELRESLVKIEGLDEKILKRVSTLSVLEESVDEVRTTTRRSIAKLKKEVEEKLETSFASYQEMYTDSIEETKKAIVEKLEFNDGRINELAKDQQQIKETLNFLLKNNQKVLQQLDSILTQQENGINHMKDHSAHIVNSLKKEQTEQFHQFDEQLQKASATLLNKYDKKTMELESTLKEEIVELQGSLTALKSEQEETIKIVSQNNQAHEEEVFIQKQNLKKVGWIVGCGVGLQICLEVIGFFLN
ncbi:hypothetical protein [Falsibacillus albus]|uniref:Uncharacterized protein n=1 Tax=Falsibacillus albus TaxID=2478915 RepID=A0A3L7K2A4_9BACI|nr:hypothetical protein [Falsibacillus albus]RLQ94822.1 hypothetical protein D9X91_12590 [Falsibacillus albus]